MLSYKFLVTLIKRTGPKKSILTENPDCFILSYMTDLPNAFALPEEQHLSVESLFELGCYKNHRHDNV